MVGNIQRPEREDPSGLGRWWPGLFIATLLLFVAARLWRLTSTCLWFDEIFSVHAARHNWSELIKFVAADLVHPPLFYALLKFWITLGGESLLWLRLFPVLFSVATIVPFWFLCRDLKLKPAETNLALLLMAVSRFQLGYAQEVRMYSPLLFFSVLSIWLFIRFLRSQKSPWQDLVALTAINLCLVYVHYYGWAVVAVEGLILLFWRRERLGRFLLSVAVLVLAFSPWVYALAVAPEGGPGLAQNLGWFTRPGWRDVQMYFVVMSEPFLFSQFRGERFYDPLAKLLVWLVFGLPLIVFCYRMIRGRRLQDEEAWLLMFAFGPVIGALVLSWILPYPVWGSRHLIICAVPYFILAAIAILRVPLTWLKSALLLVLAGWVSLAAAISLWTRAPEFTWCSWPQLVQQLSPEDKSTATVFYAFEDLVAYHLWFSLSTGGEGKFKIIRIRGIEGLDEDPAFFLPRRFDDIEVRDQLQITDEHLWLAFRNKDWDQNRPPVSLLQQAGYRVQKVYRTSRQGEQSFLVEVARRP